MMPYEDMGNGLLAYYVMEGGKKCYSRCVVCGKKLEHSKARKAACHHCSPKVIGAIEGANIRMEEPQPDKRTYGARLAAGFVALHGQAAGEE